MDFDVSAVTPHSPADEAGVRSGDRIIVFDGRNIERSQLGIGDIDLTRLQPLPLTIRRGTQQMTVVIQPREIL